MKMSILNHLNITDQYFFNMRIRYFLIITLSILPLQYAKQS